MLKEAPSSVWGSIPTPATGDFMENEVTIANDGDNSTVEIKTPTDLKIEALENAMATMQTKYDSVVSQLVEANKGLWAQLHPVHTAVSEPIVKTVEDLGKEALDSFEKALGIKE